MLSDADIVVVWDERQETKHKGKAFTRRTMTFSRKSDVKVYVKTGLLFLLIALYCIATYEYEEITLAESSHFMPEIEVGCAMQVTMRQLMQKVEDAITVPLSVNDFRPMQLPRLADRTKLLADQLQAMEEALLFGGGMLPCTRCSALQYGQILIMVSNLQGRLEYLGPSSDTHLETSFNLVMRVRS